MDFPRHGCHFPRRGCHGLARKTKARDYTYSTSVSENRVRVLRVKDFGVKVEPVPKIPFRGPYEAHAMGARAVNAALTAKQRQANARKAIAARWAKRKLAA